MAYKQGHESLESYTDNLKVKISERYKPPPRISPIMTYAQRLILNKQTQDNMPTYDFLLEKAVLEKIREWKLARKQAVEDRQSKLDKIREEMAKKKEEEQFEKEQLEELEKESGGSTKTANETVAVTNINNNFENPALSVNSYLNSSILMPTQAGNYSTILTPIPLQNYGNHQFGSKKDDRSPFNISDFENDTSSPFDNMELKSINDMEELAQVLNKGEKVVEQTPHYSTYPQNMIQQPHQNYNYLSGGGGSAGGPQYSYIPNSASYAARPSNSNYSYTNGYYFPSDMMQPNQSFTNPYNSYSKTTLTNYSYNDPFQSTTTQLETKKSACKSVPDIMNALETELENIQLSSKKENFVRNVSSSQTVRPKSTEAVYTIKESDDPFNTLNKSDQDLCRLISSMGFPLSRVARVCKLLGSDQKKIVDHLLALSDLLDLGFSETNVSDALLQCDNDRDKALDRLIL